MRPHVATLALLLLAAPSFAATKPTACDSLHFLSPGSAFYRAVASRCCIECQFSTHSRRTRHVTKTGVRVRTTSRRDVSAVPPGRSSQAGVRPALGQPSSVASTTPAFREVPLHQETIGGEHRSWVCRHPLLTVLGAAVLGATLEHAFDRHDRTKYVRVGGPPASPCPDPDGDGDFDCDHLGGKR